MAESGLALAVGALLMTDAPDQPTEASVRQRRDNWSRETFRSQRCKIRNLKAEMGRHDAGRAKDRVWFWSELRHLRERIARLTAERDDARAALQEAEERVTSLHALVCNAFGYDKSIVRVMAMWMRGQVNNQYRELGQRVMDAEEAARRAAPCDVVHPLAAPVRSDREVQGE